MQKQYDGTTVQILRIQNACTLLELLKIWKRFSNWFYPTHLSKKFLVFVISNQQDFWLYRSWYCMKSIVLKNRIVFVVLKFSSYRSSLKEHSVKLNGRPGLLKLLNGVIVVVSFVYLQRTITNKS
eukprot:TRINITY_DN1139_c0_g3_i4.p3 TRINITY_DN1139_c0_g3~~TRINITY_DN1139_c0_g3_i4.p3  ORF type:complete len:125 (-),score=1.81 TRINITY_DN1139_c0_g3_i4:56-430(-)